MIKRAFYLILSLLISKICYAFSMPQIQTRLTDDNTKVTDYLFSLDDKVQSAVFTRNGFTWIIFDRLLWTQDNPLSNSSFFEKIQVIPSKTNTILQLVLPENLFPQVQKKGNLWIFSLAEKKENTNTLPIIPLKKEKGIYFKTERTKPVEWIDPVTQERLIAFPLSLPEEYVSSEYSVPSLKILPTIQGIALAPQTSKLFMQEEENGFLLTAPNGLFENEKIPFEWENKQELLDFSIYKHFTQQDFFTEKNRLQSLISNAPAEQKETFRLEMARLYLSQNLPAHALEILSNTGEKEETICLKAVALSLLNRDEEALKLFNQVKNVNFSLYFWKNLVNPKKRLLTSYIQQMDFSDPLKATILSKALQKAFNRKDIAAQKSLLEDFAKTKKTPYQTQLYHFLMGVNAENENKTLEALTNYDKAIQGPFSFIQQTAIFKKNDLALKNGDIEPKEAIRIFENMAFGLRNTKIEPELLNRLAELYSTQNNYTKALQTYKALLTITPVSDVPDKMTTLFTKALFDNQIASPLERIAFFNEFKELIPNDQTGNKMMHLIVHDLISLDLLDNAYQISTALAEHRLHGEEQQILALEASLIALLNRKPQEALKALHLIKQLPATTALFNQKAIIEAATLKALKQPYKQTLLKINLEETEKPLYFHPTLQSFFLEIKESLEQPQ